MKSLVDCRYFLNSRCEMGKKCPYRHCDQARGTHIECPKFVNRTCYSVTCKFRHTVNKENIYCYYEHLAGGCRKHNCAFQHIKKKFKANPNIIGQFQSEVGENVCDKLSMCNSF
ncbi:hypothetical protein TNCV_3031531 [Trichonephila clavipes]|nr:hypothetical protein TNCV_3031531 [Trichonephila clavipes]